MVKSIAIFLLLGLLLLGCEDVVKVTVPEERLTDVIQVVGTGVAYGKPDVAILSLGVSVERKSVEEATRAAAEAMRRVIDSLRANGVAEEDIQTKSFSIQPRYDYVDRKQILRGYEVTNMVSVKVRDLDAVGRIVDDAVEAGGDALRVNSIAFTIDDPTELQAEARVKAIRDAKAKAEALAEEGGVKLGRPIIISESVFLPVKEERYFKGGVPEEASTPIAPGTLEFRVTVYVTFEIEG